MPRDPRSGLAFVFGVWAALALLGPIGSARGAEDPDPRIAELEAKLHEAVNAFRRAQNLVPLERRESLDAVARAHSRDMIRRGYFSHDAPEGGSWVDRMREAGIEGFSLAGENLGQTSRAPPTREIVRGWKRSPAHRKNLTARPVNATGIGIARAPDGTLFYTQLYVSFPRE